MVLNTLLKYSFTRIYNKFSPCPLQKFDRYWLIPFLKPIQVLFPQKVHSKACVEPGFPPRYIKLPKTGGDQWKKLKENSIQKRRQVRVGGSEGTQGVQSSQGPLRGEAMLVLHKKMNIKIENTSKILICWTQQVKHGFVFPFQLQEHLEGSESTITPKLRDKINWFLSCRIKWSKTESELPDLGNFLDPEVVQVASFFQVLEHSQLCTALEGLFQLHPRRRFGLA